jgi:hypothetical protein
MTRGPGITKGSKVETNQVQGFEHPRVTETDKGLPIGLSLHPHTDQNRPTILLKIGTAGHPTVQTIMTGIALNQLGIRTPL